MTRTEAIAKLNNAGISVAANAKDNAIFVGVGPTKLYGVINYKSSLVLNEDDGIWSFDPSLIGSPSTEVHFHTLDACVSCVIMLVKMLNNV